eukprot:CAMPEP_0197025222 /NCGR_PEP_ID=MMETSP1384-20130603/5621_1 /TAXON_ID=29189 /ORGANISM="Ammonia sp." /LENGTH=470 /DNA_ID=CAMNT_0042453723 /DNA_START=210 /DNA_END=1622 /DNA_ORIENTATION=-
MSFSFSNNNTSNGLSWGNTGANNTSSATNNSNANNTWSWGSNPANNNSNQPPQQQPGQTTQSNAWNSNSTGFSFGQTANNNNNTSNSFSTFNSNSNAANSSNALNPNNDHVVRDAPNDAISRIKFHPSKPQFIASSWDSSVSVYEFFGNNQSKKLGEKKHEKPVLSCCFDASGDNIFSAGCDNLIKIWNPQQNQFANLGQHQAPVRCIEYSSTHNFLISGSWDRSISFWDPRNASNANAKPVFTQNLGHKVHAMAQRGNYLSVALSNVDIKSFDLRQQAKEVHSVRQEQSQNDKAVALKKQIRCIDIFPNCEGYVAASVGGRVIIKHFNRMRDSNKDFSYKCHRHNVKTNSTHVFSVNVVKFHNQSAVFATAGDDGEIVTWDKDGRSKLHGFKKLEISNFRNNPSLGYDSNVTVDRMPIVSLDYHNNGQYMLYATSYNWNKGEAFHDRSQQIPAIYLHQVNPKEVDKNKK